MNVNNKKHSINYDRVMPRVYSRSHSNLKSNSNVTRHEIPSSVRVGAKPSLSNVSSGVFRELPTVLNDYMPDTPCAKLLKRTNIVKPRRTIKSLDPTKSPPRPLVKPKEKIRETNINIQGSVPLLNRNVETWYDTHVRKCYSSRSHTRLQELKDEIKAYAETEKLMKLRSQLYKKCGVVLDDVGQVAEDKAVQAEIREPEKEEAERVPYTKEKPKPVQDHEVIQFSNNAMYIDAYR